MSASAFTMHFESRPDIQRRVGDVDFSADGCWLWPAKRYTKVGPDGERKYLHRISLELKIGQPLGALSARHSCDRPPCCNPDHLTSGTHAENMRDMAIRGRARNTVFLGITNGQATLTDDQIVCALRRLTAGETITAIAASCGVTRRAVMTWRDGTARRTAHLRWREICEGSTTGNDGRPYMLRVWVGEQS